MVETPQRHVNHRVRSPWVASGSVAEPIPLDEIRSARERIADAALRTPLVPLELAEAPCAIHLKLENLQPIGSFKIRGAGNAMALADPRDLEGGVWTASAGNMAQGVAWHARRLGVPCAVVVPESAPPGKRDAIQRLGARLVDVPFDEWIEVFRTRRREGMEGLFIHPFSDRAVMAGNGTIGLEIWEDLPDLDAVLVPYGGGGLCTGIASAIKALAPAVRVYACEVETAAPLAPSLEAGTPVQVEFTSSFVDGIGSPVVFPEMFEMVRTLIDGSLVVGLEEVAEAVRILATRARVVAEGAGATAVAAALSGRGGGGRVACVVSGGNIDSDKLGAILEGAVPGAAHARGP
jgi:threonine dehydratase